VKNGTGFYLAERAAGDRVAEFLLRMDGMRGQKMVEQVVRLTVSFAVSEAQMDEFKKLAQTMTEVSKAEPGTLGYEWFASADGKSFRLVETYVDAEAIEAHFMGAAVQEWVPKLVGTCSVTGFEIYGDPGPKVTEMASGFGAQFYKYWIGIGR
jgi:quinol monooxygenase YgiN